MAEGPRRAPVEKGFEVRVRDTVRLLQSAQGRAQVGDAQADLVEVEVERAARVAFLLRLDVDERVAAREARRRELQDPLRRGERSAVVSGKPCQAACNAF